MLNDTFSLRRIALYARKHYAENGRYYLSVGAIVLCLLLALLLVLNDGQDFFYSVAAVVGVAAGASWLHRTCRPYYKPVQANMAYMVPLTQAEKYLFCWFNSYVVWGVVFIVLLLLVVGASHIRGFGTLHLTAPFEWFGWSVLLACTVLHAAAFFCCSWARKSPLKGYLLMGGIVIAGIVAYERLMMVLGGGIVIAPFPGSTLIAVVTAPDTTCIYCIEPFPHADAVRHAVAVAAALFFWTAGYFKFKERTLK